MVYYTKTRRENIYNLGFGDYKESIDDFDDLVITNNGDSQKVLATVARSLFTFTDRYPDAAVRSLLNSRRMALMKRFW